MRLLLLLAFFQFQLQEVPPFELITTQSGLSNSIVYDIYQDREGYIWMATDKGLNRFDGYEFQVFYHNPDDSTSISSNIVRGLLEDEQGRLWIGTKTGFNLFDRETETFTRFQKEIPEDQYGLDVQQMDIDAKGRIWFNLGSFNTKDQSFSLLDKEDKAYSLAVGDDGQIWTLSLDGELKQIKSGKAVEVSSTYKQKYQVHIGEYSGRLWLNEPLQMPSQTTGLLPVLPGNIEPRELLETDSATLWIGTDAGLYRYHWPTQQLKKVDFKEHSSALTESIRSLYQDPSGGIWVGTLNGVFHFDPHQKPFKHINMIEEGSEVVMGMESTSDGYLVNLLGKGLYQSKDGIVFEEMRPDGLGLTQFNYVWDIEEVPQSSFPIWLATNEGVLLFQPKTGRWKTLDLMADALVSFAIKQGKSQQVWLVSANNLYLADAKRGKIIQQYSLAAWNMKSIIQDIALVGDYIFLATESDGLFVFDTQEQKIKPLKQRLSQGDDLFGIPIWDLFVDDTTLWIGTKGGLYQLDINTWRQEKVNLGSNNEDKVVFSIEELPDGTIWMGTENGLLSYEKDSGQAIFYDTDDGLTNTEFNRKSILKTKEGRLWLGGVSGITVFDPNEIRKNDKVPPVYIRDVEVITSEGTSSINVKVGESIRLPWHKNTLVVHFVALNYTNPGQNQYQYKLAGYEPEWSTVDDLTARYVQLPPGDYSFLLKAANNDGLWNPDTIRLNIQITPPFWKTWWFRTLIVLIIAFILWRSYRYRVKSLLEVERMRLRIAGDLHDEVGSGLSGIALTGDLLQSHAEKGKIKPELVHRITDNARNLASSLDSIVWLIDPKKESLGDFLTKTKLVARELLGEEGLVINETVSTADRERYLNPEQKRNLFLLAKESMNNVAKHANASLVQLNLKADSTHFRFALEDDGAGFEPGIPSERNGLQSMQHRADELKADLKINSKPGTGTKIELVMKLP